MASAAGTDVWTRTWIGWDVVFAVASIVAVLAVVADGGAATGSRIAAATALVLLAGWYAATGARALRTRSERLGLLYLAGMLPLFLVAFSQHGAAGLLLFVLFPQTWSMVHSYWQAVAANVVLTAGVGLLWLLALGGSAIATATWAVAALGFSLLMGLWISGIIDQSMSRRTVIAELEQARAELAAVSHRAGVLAERERLAREIHDTLAQGFTSVVVLLELAESDVDTDPAAARRRLVAARDTARQNLAEARGLVAALSPADLQVAPLPEALGRLASRFESETGLPAAFSVRGPVAPLAANREVVLLRSAQEALSNVRKHAGACSVSVTLAFAEGGAALTVTDDGSGFDPAAPTAGFGLAGMGRRVAEIGGTLDVHSGPSGTTVGVRC
jgi:signal transduction histidine kinase